MSEGGREGGRERGKQAEIKRVEEEREEVSGNIQSLSIEAKLG